MLYLSQLVLDGHHRLALRDLSDCRALHQRVLGAFPDGPEITSARDHYGVLFRVEPVEGGARVLVQSRAEPDWSRLPSGYLGAPARTKSLDAAYAQVTVGREFVFRLRANPTKRISAGNASETERWHGKRVELRREEDQIAWLRRKGTQAGFALVTVRAGGEVAQVQRTGLAGRVSSQRGPQPLAFGSVVFEGRLRVTDAALFRQALEDGIGSGKAFGFGLLSIAALPCD